MIGKMKIREKSGFPKSVKIAEFACIDYLGIGLEFGNRLVLRSEVLAKHTIFGDEFNPLNIVSLGHRMIHRTYSDTISIAGLLNHGDMFFLGTVGSVLLE
jgi:hypothetical protein